MMQQEDKENIFMNSNGFAVKNTANMHHKPRQMKRSEFQQHERAKPGSEIKTQRKRGLEQISIFKSLENSHERERRNAEQRSYTHYQSSSSFRVLSFRPINASAHYRMQSPCSLSSSIKNNTRIEDRANTVTPEHFFFSESMSDSTKVNNFVPDVPFLPSLDDNEDVDYHNSHGSFSPVLNRRRRPLLSDDVFEIN